ncbi:glycoside hydrolase family 99-like domain-containing protein, partial [bacterium]|nr:glycoside hydrolase family 99-like domain-containing protein [bacterium]
GGPAEIYWSGTLKSKYGGFSPGKSTPFQLVGDGKWHVYRLRPGWEPEKKIIHLRLDFPAASAGKRDAVAVDYVRIMQPAETPSAAEPSWDFAAGAGGWSLEDPDAGRMAAADGALAVRSTTRPARIVSPSVKFPAEQRFFVSLRLTADKGQTATLGFATDAQAGFHVHNFPIRADGQPHSYLLDLSAERQWRGHIRLLTLEPTDAAEASARIHSLHVTNEPKGQPEVVLRAFGLADGLARAGHPLALTASFANVGSAPAGSVEATIALPRGLTAKGPSTQRLDDLWYGETRTLEWNVTASQPLRGTVKISVSADGQKPFAQTTAVAIGPSLRLPKHDYVPVPKPAKTDYNVGVYYFPGWHTWSRWRPILDYPERKPLLGWYDEAKPEVADWQIKWAVEHGISFFAVDWYWCQGARHLEHWLHDAYFKARYRHLLKFCLLWANHNPPDTSSEADLLKVTDYWLAHYFKRPEHLTVEGKPVVIIFSTYRFTKDMGTPALAAAFGKMRQRCKDAGLPGLYLVACTQADRRTIEQLKAQGYDAVSGYNYPSLGAGGRKRASFEALVPEYKKLWNAAADHKLLKEIPVLSGGWDSRPWHHQKALVRYGRTPALFEQHCRDSKQFLDTRDAEMPPRLRMCLIEAWNEWGEGSYIGPHAEYGFGYLEAVRKVFAPTSPKPLEVIPRDIGLGPYDLPRPTSRVQHAWDFARAADRADWHLSSQIDRKPSDTSLHGVATGRDPVIGGPTVRLPARQYGWLRLEARASQPDAAQLFWATTTAPVSENNSIRFDLPGDGRWHTLWIDLRSRPYWTGLILGLRFDPAGQA